MYCKGISMSGNAALCCSLSHNIEGLIYLEEVEGRRDDIITRAIHLEVCRDLCEHHIKDHEVICQSQPLC